MRFLGYLLRITTIMSDYNPFNMVGRLFKSKANQDYVEIDLIIIPIIRLLKLIVWAIIMLLTALLLIIVLSI